MDHFILILKKQEIKDISEKIFGFENNKDRRKEDNQKKDKQKKKRQTYIEKKDRRKEERQPEKIQTVE